MAGSRFDLVCANNAWVGVGKYTQEGDRLRFSFRALTKNGEVIKNPEAVEYVFSGRGNEMTMSLPEGARNWTWSRILPGEDAQR
ncbi:MAG: hypothetical protein ACAH95_14110 [Fimbriimonas sp.]